MGIPSLTPVADPPFWRPMSAADFAALTGLAPEAEPLDALPDWERGAFRMRCPPLGYSALVGWVRPPFAVCDLSIRGFPAFGELTHLPTGNWVGLFASPREAARAADVLLPLTDWEAVTVEAAPRLVDPVCAALEGAGFTGVNERTDHMTLRVWRRGALH